MDPAFQALLNNMQAEILNLQAQVNAIPTPPTVGVGCHIKAVKPPKYSGSKVYDPSIIDNFLFQSEQYFLITTTLGEVWTDLQKIVYVVNLLEGAALTWWRGYIFSHPTWDTAMTWNQFKTAITRGAISITQIHHEPKILHPERRLLPKGANQPVRSHEDC